MPITSSAIKAAKQAEARRIRRQPYKTQLRTTMRAFIDLMKDGKKDEATNILPRVYKVIDTAAKKHILHPKNAARKKSRMARLLK